LDIHDLLRAVRDGKIGIEEAARSLRLSSLKEVEGACLDVSREMRKGVPEIILAEGKSLKELKEIARVFLEESGRVIITRVTEGQASQMKKIIPSGCKASYNARGRTLVLKGEKFILASTSGRVAIMTAGTADIGVAEEARTVLEEMGCEVLAFYDIGVAGIHRLFPAIKQCIEAEVSAMIVVAGMEGALPSVVSGLSTVPVIGVPSSSGYGLGGKGEGALVSMLQSCSPGLVVVNVDNGVGAAVAAALIARGESPSEGRTVRKSNI
jgi:NCAIR mutase (PurE)-related protein